MLSSVLFLLLASAPMSQLQAYTDPGSGLLLWQSLVGAFSGGLFYFRKYIFRLFQSVNESRRKSQDQQ